MTVGESSTETDLFTLFGWVTIRCRWRVTFQCRFTFALSTADFILCQRCGVYLGAVIATRHGSVGILNLNTLTAELPSIQPATPVFYDAEEKSQRVGRREKLWTPVEGEL